MNPYSNNNIISSSRSNHNKIQAYTSMFDMGLLIAFVVKRGSMYVLKPVVYMSMEVRICNYT